MARSHSSCVKSSRTPETRSFGLIGRRQTGQIRSFLLLAPRGAARSTKIHPPPARRIPVRLTSDVSHGPVAPLTLPRCQATQVKLIFVDMGRATIPIKLHVHLNVIAVYGQVRAHMLRPFRPRPTFGLERQREVVHRLSLCELWCGGRRRSPSAFTCVEQNATPGPTSAAGTRQDGKAFHALI